MKSQIKKATKLALIFMFTLITTATFAQRKEGKHRRPQCPPPIPNTEEIVKMVNKLSDEISLSEEQKTKVLALYNNHFKEVKSKIDHARPKREEMDMLKKNFEKSVKSVLTKKQQKQFTVFVKKNSKNRPPRKYD